MALEIGQIIDGKYRIEKLIGEGGMGAVYAGENTRIKRRVAIKVLHAQTAENAEAVVRFEREAQAAGTIGNDHILEILDLGVLPNGDRFMVMEFLDGEPLSKRIERKGKLTPKEAYPLVRQALEGLDAAHAAGITHRDLKPDNLFVLREKAGRPDYVKIIDFGISKFQPLSGEAGMNMTRTGAVLGTPYYMSPEQASGSSDADGRSDIYTMAVILYETITGTVPFLANTVNELLFKIVLATPPPPESIVPELDAGICSIIAKGMAREKAHRFQSCKEFLEALDAWAQSGRGVSVPPQGDARASMVAKLEAQTVVAGQAPTRGTEGNWATSNTAAETLVSQVPPEPKPRGKGAIVAVVGVVAVLAVAVVGYTMTSGKHATEPTSQSLPVADPAAQKPATVEPKPEPSPVVARVVASADTAASAEAAPSASAAPAKDAAKATKKDAAAPPNASKPDPKAAARPTPAAPPAAKPAGKPDLGY